MVKFFINGSFCEADLNLNNYEQKIFISILKKKKFIFNKKRLFELDQLNKLAERPPLKKREANLKFVLPKAVKFLKTKLVNPLVSSIGKYSIEGKKILKKKNDFFYEHYFGQIAKKEGIPIEKFFVFRNWTHRYSDNIPKTITTETLSMWKKNPEFHGKMLEYLNEHFLEELEKVIEFKIEAKIYKWNQLAFKEGVDRAIGKILKLIESKGGKMPWTLVEARNALWNTLDIIS